MYSISRKKLVKIAFKAINEYQAVVSETNRAHLLYAACTVKKIALGGWVIDKTCGCLVGSAYLNAVPADKVDRNWTPSRDAQHWDDDGEPQPGPRVLTESEREAAALDALGMRFDQLLYDVVDPDRKFSAHGAIQVID